MQTRYLNIIRRWLWVLVVMPILAGVVAFVLSKLTTPVYEASTTIWVSQASSGSGQQYSDILAAERLAKTYGALITKRPVLQETIDELHLKLTPDQLSNSIEVKMVRDTQLLEVSVRNTDATLASTIVNKLADVFQKQNLAAQKQSYNDATQKLNSQVTQLDAQIKEAQKNVQSLKAIAKPDDAQRAELDRLNSTLTQYQVSYSSVLKSLEDIRLSEANSINNVTVAEQAMVPHDPVSPRITMNIVIGLVLGLLLAIGLIALLEYLDDSFKSTEDIQSALNLSTLGVVEFIGGKGTRRRKHKSSSTERPAPAQNLVSLSHVGSHITEAYRLLRTNLDFAALDHPVRKLLVTSALPQEGKSTTSANLAVVMAQSGKRVLLIDVDLRRPTVHKLFKVPNQHGLTSLLLGVATAEEAIQEVGIENLQVLTSGPIPPSPADTLSSEAMNSLLDTLAGRFDVIITDSPPVLVASDAVILASRMDGVLLVVAAGATSRRVARNALDALQRSSSPILGAVLNMQQQSSKQSYYYYDYKAPKQTTTLSSNPKQPLTPLLSAAQKSKEA